MENVTGFGRRREGGRDMVMEDGRPEAGVTVLEDTERPLLASRSSEAVIMWPLSPRSGGVSWLLLLWRDLSDTKWITEARLRWRVSTCIRTHY